MTFNPIQTNQRPKREKIAERIWEWLRPIVFGISPWFARRWRLMWVRFAAKFVGAEDAIVLPFLCQNLLELNIHGILELGIYRLLALTHGCMR